ncbi:hypothetical protein Taro_049810 [Colocasia esculenta]|uniref:Uncharacterized protein n=1 Tax=Colocasia esculenta TaxID=4460 RepID=A0A843XBZ7_COLES|nr:hypothetical protein [Colocasia esculenta]
MSVVHVNTLTSDFSLIGRREQVVGSSVYATRSQFGDGGRDHEIQIQCRGEGRDTRESELCVCVDKKKVVHVRRLRWNFQGNQTIFVDGVAVDMMWDVHDWWFSDAAPDCAAFMFRARGVLEYVPTTRAKTTPCRPPAIGLARR